MKKILAIAFASALALGGFAADAAGVKKIAVFAQNKSAVRALDAQVPAIRERIVAAFAEVDGFQIVDSTLASESFEKSPNVAQMLNCDYVVVATILNATTTRRNLSGRPNTIFSLRMAFKMTDRNGVSVDGMPTWSGKNPILDADPNSSEYFEMLIDRWENDMTVAVATKAAKWRSPTVATLATVRVQTSIDYVVAALESQTKGVSGEQLQELRKVVGGASVEIDGVVVGTAPCDVRASAGLHKIRLVRDWTKPYEATVNVQDGLQLNIALEMSDEGIRKWSTVEALRADVAKRYAEAAATRGVKVNIDTAAWRDVAWKSGAFMPPPAAIKIENH